MAYACKVVENEPNESELIKRYGYFDDGKQIGTCAIKLYSRGKYKGAYLLMNVVIEETVEHLQVYRIRRTLNRVVR